MPSGSASFRLSTRLGCLLLALEESLGCPALVPAVLPEVGGRLDVLDDDGLLDTLEVADVLDLMPVFCLVEALLWFALGVSEYNNKD